MALRWVCVYAWRTVFTCSEFDGASVMVFGAVCPFGGPRSSRQERPVGWLNCGEALTPHEVKDTMCWEVCGEVVVKKEGDTREWS